MLYVKSKFTGECWAIYDASALQYNGWVRITKKEYDEYNKRMGYVK